MISEPFSNLEIKSKRRANMTESRYVAQWFIILRRILRTSLIAVSTSLLEVSNSNLTILGCYIKLHDTTHENLFLH
jgi:hypothetical protein